MTIGLRIMLFIGAVFTTYYFAKQVRNGEVEVQYSLFWIIFSLVLVVISVFPNIIIFTARIIGVQSPANLLFLIIIFVLLLKEFNTTLKLSKLEEQLTHLIQKIALEEKENNRTIIDVII